ncbi:hypothetical protein AX774_g1296 [Zancudomyces culisetae]|uniref:Uncharacterized protein n=1 Tax=Zancudomyces culisetae TaxID=1213189 RepID=A0A1R1PW61_ZANCU|nr:hypothetical protein AX774_g1296 [Zancudomyces culisetae]|eukprot:OMH85153.1 hypothetical protein AX774_g1296 [Zancudomyces culisetae]
MCGKVLASTKEKLPTSESSDNGANAILDTIINVWKDFVLDYQNRQQYNDRVLLKYKAKNNYKGTLKNSNKKLLKPLELDSMLINTLLSSGINYSIYRGKGSKQVTKILNEVYSVFMETNTFKHGNKKEKLVKPPLLRNLSLDQLGGGKNSRPIIDNKTIDLFLKLATIEEKFQKGIDFWSFLDTIGFGQHLDKSNHTSYSKLMDMADTKGHYK